MPNAAPAPAPGPEAPPPAAAAAAAGDQPPAAPPRQGQLIRLPANPPPGDAVPATGPTTNPTTGPTTGPSTSPTSHPAREISLNFKDTPLDAVLDYLSEAAGFAVIKEQPIPPDTRVTVQSKQPVGPEEAVTLLSSVLKATGYTAQQNGRVLKIMARDKAKKGSLPVRVGSDPESIDQTDEMITQVIPIRYMDAVKLKTNLQPLLDKDADVAADDASNAIVITDTSANIRRIAQVIAAMDQGDTSATSLKMVHLKNASAKDAEKLIKAVFKAEGGGGGGRQSAAGAADGDDPQRPHARRRAAGAGGGSGGRGKNYGGAVDQALHGKVNAVSDDRTNTLVVTAPAEAMTIVEGVLKELDSNPIPESQLKAFHLKYAEAEATAKLITSIYKGDTGRRGDDDFPFYISRFTGGGGDQSKVKITATSDERTNTVLVTAPAAAMAQVEQTIKELDANPVGTADIRVFQLKYADAYSTEKLITSIFNPKKSDDNDSPFRIIFLGSGPNQGGKAGKVTAASDDRTNTLVITAPTDMLSRIEGIIKQIDANPAAEETMLVYHLRNAQAANLELVLNVLFGNIQGGGGGGQPNQGQQIGPDGQPLGQGQNRGGGGRSGRSGGNNLTGNNSAFDRGGNNRRNNRRNGNMPQISPGLQRATTELSGQVFVVADRDSNSLLITTASKYLERVRAIVEELDRPVPQVLIKVLIVEVTHDDSSDIGADFSILNKRANGNGQSAITNFGNAAAQTVSGGLAVSIMETNFAATLHLLQTQGKLDVLSRPYILASDNQQATITVGQEVPFITNSQITELGGVNNTVRYDDIGIILDVTPHINPDGLVILDVSPEISQLTGTSIPIGNSVSSPVIAKRSADSRVGVKNGQTVVIGGLMEDRKTLTVNKVPILGDLPFVGPAFSRTQSERPRPNC